MGRLQCHIRKELAQWLKQLPSLHARNVVTKRLKACRRKPAYISTSVRHVTCFSSRRREIAASFVPMGVGPVRLSREDATIAKIKLRTEAIIEDTCDRKLYPGLNR